VHFLLGGIPCDYLGPPFFVKKLCQFSFAGLHYFVAHCSLRLCQVMLAAYAENYQFFQMHSLSSRIVFICDRTVLR